MLNGFMKLTHDNNDTIIIENYDFLLPLRYFLEARGLIGTLVLWNVLKTRQWSIFWRIYFIIVTGLVKTPHWVMKAS